jgi:hypothetical protein
MIRDELVAIFALLKRGETAVDLRRKHLRATAPLWTPQIYAVLPALSATRTRRRAGLWPRNMRRMRSQMALCILRVSTASEFPAVFCV